MNFARETAEIHRSDPAHAVEPASRFPAMPAPWDFDARWFSAGRKLQAGKVRKSRPRRANPTGDKTDIGIGILEAAKMRHLVLDRSQGIDCEGKAGTRRNMID
jgi:hypothetical protein